MFDLIWFLLVGLLAGWLAGQLMKGREYGLLKSMIVGVIGALLGGFILDVLGFEAQGTLAKLLTATGGAVLLLFLLERFGRRRAV